MRKVLCKKSGYFLVFDYKSNFIKKLSIVWNWLGHFIFLHQKTLLFKKGKYYKIVEETPEAFIVESEMTNAQIVTKKAFSNYFCTEAELRRKKLLKMRRKKIIKKFLYIGAKS